MSMSNSPPDERPKSDPDLLLIRPQSDGDPPPPGGAQTLPRLSPSSPLLVIEPSGALPALPDDPIPILPSGALLSLQPLPPSAAPPQDAEVIPPLSASRPMLVINTRGGPLPVLAPDADPEAEAEAGRALQRRLNAVVIEALHQLGEPAQAPAVEPFQAERVLWQGGDRLVTLVSAWRALRQQALPQETGARVLALLVLYVTHTLGRPLTLTASALQAVQQALAEMNQPLSQLLRLMSGVEARLNPPQPPSLPQPSRPQAASDGQPGARAASPGPGADAEGERSRPGQGPGPAQDPRARPRRLLIAGAAASLALALAGYLTVAGLSGVQTLDPAPLADLLPVKKARLTEGAVEITLADESFAALPPEAQRALLRRLIDRLEQRGNGARRIHMGVLRSPGQEYFFQSGVGDTLVLTPQARRKPQAL